MKGITSHGVGLIFLLLLSSQATLANSTECKHAFASTQLGQTVRHPTASMSRWSTDFLVLALRECLQSLLPHCPGKQTTELYSKLQETYLNRLGVPRKLYGDTTLRALLVPENEGKLLKKRIAEVIASNPPKDPKTLVERLFGKVTLVKGVPVLSGTSAPTAVIEGWVETVCQNLKPCPFWNTENLFKVVLIQQPGIASYRLETATLVLSKNVLEEPNLLHQFVFTHELAHAAVADAHFRRFEDWGTSFRQFSGWDIRPVPPPNRWVLKTGPAMGDKLTDLSKSSPFSILPDDTIESRSLGDKRYEGFVLARSYRATLEQTDTDEDLADHIAAFVLTPKRYCRGETALAPGKYRWVSKVVFGQEKGLRCSASR